MSSVTRGVSCRLNGLRPLEGPPLFSDFSMSLLAATVFCRTFAKILVAEGIPRGRSEEKKKTKSFHTMGFTLIAKVSGDPKNLDKVHYTKCPYIICTIFQN